MSNFLSRLGRKYIRPLEKPTRFVINLVLAALAGALVCVLLGAAIDWIYQIGDPVITVILPALAGAALRHPACPP